MDMKEQIRSAHKRKALWFCAAAGAAFTLIFLRCVEADASTLFCVMSAYASFFGFALKWHDVAQKLERAFSMLGEITNTLPPLADLSFKSIDWAAPERPPRSIP